jgi:regulator of sigma E protease
VLTGIIAVVLGLGLMVLIHEFGHFIVARLFGVRVDVFSFGLGPRLFGIKRGATDYRFSALPVGGYVRMAGENPADERTGDPDEFLSKPRWQRMFIVLAGPTTNVLLAIALTAGLFIYGGEQPTYADKPVVIAGVMKDSPAAEGGIQPGDHVVSFAGAQNPTWDRIALELALSAPGRSVPVVVERAGQRVSLSVASDVQPFEVLGYPAEPVLVGTVVSGGAAEAAGLMPGDSIVAADGQEMQSYLQLSEFIQQNEGKPIQLEIERNSQRQTISMRPSWGDPGDGKARWLIGITYRFATVERSYSVPTAVVKASQFHVVLASKMLFMIGQLFTGKASMKQLQGPLGIVQESSRAAKRGFADLVSFMALVSLNLGVLNLLPIPILDGGHILMLGIEGVLRKDLSLKVKERILTTGMVLLLAVFLFVTFNDITRLLGIGTIMRGQ